MRADPGMKFLFEVLMKVFLCTKYTGSVLERADEAEEHLQSLCCGY